MENIMKRKFSALVFVWAFLLGATTNASLDTIGINGINSAGLALINGQPLNGAGVRVGQVEESRPGHPDVDNAMNSNSLIKPSVMVLQNGGGITPNMNLGIHHSTRVAGILISKDTTVIDGDAPVGIVVLTCPQILYHRL